MSALEGLAQARRFWPVWLTALLVVSIIRIPAAFADNAVANAGVFSGETAWDDGYNFHFRAVCNHFYPHIRVFIDFDDNPNTGYTVNGIGADYMIEDEKLFHSRHSGVRWDWGNGNPIVSETKPSPNTYEFSVSLDSVGSPQQAKVALEGVDTDGNAVDDPTVVGYMPSTTPYNPTPSAGGTTPSQTPSTTPSTPSGSVPDQEQPTPPPPSIIDDSEAGWIWSGMVEVDDVQCKGGTEHAGGPSTYAAYTFTGSGVDVYATTGPSIEAEGRVHKLGRMKIVIDGKPEGEYSLSQSFATYQSKVFSVNDLTQSVHVLQLESDAGWIDVDYIQVSSGGQPAPQSGPSNN